MRPDGHPPHRPQDHWESTEHHLAHLQPVMHISDASYPKSVQSSGAGSSRNLFARTMRDMEEQFYSTFPAARTALYSNQKGWTMVADPAQCPPSPYTVSEYDSSSSVSPATTSSDGYSPSMYASPYSLATYGADGEYNMQIDHPGVSFHAVTPSSPQARYDAASSPPYPVTSSAAVGMSMSPYLAAGEPIQEPTYPVQAHMPTQTLAVAVDVPIVPSQDYPPSAGGSRSPYILQPLNQSPPSLDPPSDPAMGSLDQAMHTPLQRKQSRIVPNPNLRVQDIIPTMDPRPPYPSPYPMGLNHYTSSFQTHQPAYDATHQSQFPGSSASYGHDASRNDAVTPSWSPPVDTASPAARSPSPAKDPIESEDAAGGSTEDSKPAKKSDKKPPLACLFCRGRKIACGPPVPGGDENTCNQCHRRSLKCEYPSESRRGMRRKRSISKLALDSDSKPPAAKNARTKR